MLVLVLAIFGSGRQRLDDEPNTPICILHSLADVTILCYLSLACRNLLHH
jgi:hypothetical protein